MELSQANDYVKKMFSCEWVKWIHPGSAPAVTVAEKKNYAENPVLNGRHCARCLNMNGCCFVKGTVPKLRYMNTVTAIMKMLERLMFRQ